MNNTKRWGLKIGVLVIMVIIAVSICAEYCGNLPLWIKYFTVPFYNILSIFVAIYISYYLVQNRTDKRRLNDIINKIIDRLFEVLSDDRLHTIKTKEDIDFVRITQKRIINQIELLEKNLSNDAMLENVKYMKEQFTAYWDLISNHIGDVEHLGKSQKDLLNYITNMEGRLSALMILLYKE